MVGGGDEDNRGQVSGTGHGKSGGKRRYGRLVPVTLTARAGDKPVATVTLGGGCPATSQAAPAVAKSQLGQAQPPLEARRPQPCPAGGGGGGYLGRDPARTPWKEGAAAPRGALGDDHPGRGPPAPARPPPPPHARPGRAPGPTAPPGPQGSGAAAGTRRRPARATPARPCPASGPGEAGATAGGTPGRRSASGGGDKAPLRTGGAHPGRRGAPSRRACPASRPFGQPMGKRRGRAVPLPPPVGGGRGAVARRGRAVSSPGSGRSGTAVP